MSRSAIHIFNVDFDKLKPGQIYSSFCGKRYIAEDVPTPEECKEIEERTRNSPVCKKCQKEKARISAVLGEKEGG